MDDGLEDVEYSGEKDLDKLDQGMEDGEDGVEDGQGDGDNGLTKVAECTDDSRHGCKLGMLR